MNRPEGHPLMPSLSPLRAASIALLALASAGATDEAPSPAAARQAVVRLPLAFEANQGQADPRVRFLARGPGYTLFLTPREAVLVLRAGRAPRGRPEGTRAAPASILRIALDGATPAPRLVGSDALPGVRHYFRGNDPGRWRSGVPAYARVEYREVYPGIDLAYHGAGGRLEYDFALAPGADPAAITLAFDGADRVQVDGDGTLRLATSRGEIRQHPPRAYQPAAGGRQAVASRYVLRGPHRVGFEVGPYDRARPLVIDPVLVFATYLGGTGFDEALAVALDRRGHVWVFGDTESADFPVTDGATQTGPAGGTDLFAAKLTPDGSALVHATYLGGQDEDFGWGLALDRRGGVYLSGFTYSNDFPGTPGRDGRVDLDAFVARLASDGTLVGARYLGGTGDDVGTGIALDWWGQVYLTGSTVSEDFPATAGAVQTTYAGCEPCPLLGGDAFVASLSGDLSTIRYATYLGGAGDDFAPAVAVDWLGQAYVTGSTVSPDFPVTPRALQPGFVGCPGCNASAVGADAFLAKLTRTGTGLVYSTFLGGSGDDFALGLAVDWQGHAFVTGSTGSADFPTTRKAFQRALGGGFDAFVARLNRSGSALDYATYLGGSGSETGGAVAVDRHGHAWVAGDTQSADFPTTRKAFQRGLGGGFDAFVAKLDHSRKRLRYSTYLGGSGDEFGFGLAVDRRGDAYVTGWTRSEDFPTRRPLQPLLSLPEDPPDPIPADAFVARISRKGKGSDRNGHDDD